MRIQTIWIRWNITFMIFQRCRHEIIFPNWSSAHPRWWYFQKRRIRRREKSQKHIFQKARDPTAISSIQLIRDCSKSPFWYFGLCELLKDWRIRMAENFDWEKVCVSKFCTVCADFVNYEKKGQETGYFVFFVILLSECSVKAPWLLK